jgi:hypothetical protein
MGLRCFSLIPVLAFALAANAQQSGATRPTATAQATASVSGRVFGVTPSGDLKPARMAHIYLVYKGRSERYEENTAGATYEVESLDRIKKALEDNLETMKEHPGAEVDENLECRREMVARDEAMLSTMEWVQRNKKLKQLLTTDADEDGVFRITRVPTGHYTLVARGQAGASNAFWSSEMTVKSGSATSVKLSAPEKSCLVSH